MGRSWTRRRGRPVEGLLLAAAVSTTTGCFSIETSIGLSLESLEVELDHQSFRAGKSMIISGGEVGRSGSAHIVGDSVEVILYNFPRGSKVSLGGVEESVEDEELRFEVPLPPSGADADVRGWLDDRRPEHEVSVPMELELVVVSRFGGRVSARFPAALFSAFEESWERQLQGSQGKPASFGARDKEPSARTRGVVVVETKPAERSVFGRYGLSMHGEARALADTRWIAYETRTPRSYHCGNYGSVAPLGGQGSIYGLSLTLGDSSYEVYERSTGAKVDSFTVAAVADCPSTYKEGDSKVREVGLRDARRAFESRMKGW